MLYHIIKKKEKINGVLDISIIGYVLNEEVIDIMALPDNMDFDEWVLTNKDDLNTGNIQLLDWFTDGKKYYCPCLQVSEIGSTYGYLDRLNINDL